MPAALAINASRKRKQTEDMEESPPKRVTRARAAKTAITEVEKPATTKKIVTASARAAATPKPATRAARLTKSAKVELQDDEDMADATEEVPIKKGRGRPRKEPQGGEGVEKTKATVMRGRPTKNVNEKATTKAAIRTRTRSDTMTDTEDALAGPTVKSKRLGARGAASGLATTPTKKSALKKKVTFEDDADLDKENVPIPKEPKKEIEKTSNMRAKPVRKANSSKAATKTSAAKASTVVPARGRKPGKKVEPESDATPLSPKKVTQIAKSASSGSEDELCDRGPLRAMAKSPVKAPHVVHHRNKQARQDQAEEPKSPQTSAKVDDAPLLHSPAKRPPPSPFKDAIRQTPKKISVDTMTDQSISTQLSFKNSIRASPRKFNLPSYAGQPGQPPISPFKTSLLKSPAKRPASPEKLNLLASPSKPAHLSPTKVTPTEEESTFKLPSITPQKLFISPRSEAAAHDVAFAANSTDGREPESPAEITFIEGTPAKVAFTQYRENPLAAYKAQNSKLKVPAPADYRSGREYESDDELMNGTPTLALCMSQTTPKTDLSDRETLGITPLAMKLGGWYSSSPEKGLLMNTSEEPDSTIIHYKTSSPEKPGFFEEGMLAVEQGASASTDGIDPTESSDSRAQVEDDKSVEMKVDQFMYTNESELAGTNSEYREGSCPISPKASQETISIHDDEIDGSAEYNEDFQDMDREDYDFMEEVSQAHQPYGDENTFPIDPRLFAAPTSNLLECPSLGQLEPSTPARSTYSRPREVHTICQVPLREEGAQESPIKVSRRRRRSMNAALEELTGEIRSASSNYNSTRSHALEESDKIQPPINASLTGLSETPRKVSYETSVIKAMMTPKNDRKLDKTSPSKSARRGADARILKGAIVYVDVHTSEGADASSIFVELLSQMGAKCIKQWNWNSRASTVSLDSANEDAPGNRAGITHVVFKDGGKRTLQKVREAKGSVLCVGVGWVLDCEQENKWLDEAQYAVDTSTIPRGGHNRRKSMEPRALSNNNGNLVRAESSSKSGYEVKSPDNRLSFGASSRRESIRVSIGPETLFEDDEEEFEIRDEVPSTPTPATPSLNVVEDYDNGIDSPTTPYFLSRGAELVQQTCPPKQSMQSLFPISGQIEDADESIRERLVLARRKSLQWAPKVRSPLGKIVSYGR